MKENDDVNKVKTTQGLNLNEQGDKPDKLMRELFKDAPINENGLHCMKDSKILEFFKEKGYIIIPEITPQNETPNS